MHVILNNLSSNEVTDIVRELRNQGLVQGQDFDFSFYQTKWDNMVGEIPKHTKFTFYEDKWATFFSLKYGHNKN
jgi:hypothetical protein